MRTGIALQLGFCSLCLTLALLGEGMGEVIADPAPVDCVWSRWSPWSSCDPCSQSRRRSRGVEVFGQFDGQACQGSLGEREYCVANTQCPVPPAPECQDSEFQCESGTCVKKRLMCNGDYDCEDGADEDCDPLRRPCGTVQLDNNEQGRTAGYGVNILGAEPRMNPFYNDYFNGRCDRVRNPTTGRYDRLPWNVGVLSYQTLVEETVSREIYEQKDTLLREMLTEVNFNIDVGLSFKFTPTEKSLSNATINAGADFGYGKKEIIKKVTEYSNIKNKSFMRVKGKVQLSTYRMRSRDLKVADEFLVHVQSLPLVYEKGIYFAFLEDYGTHYTRNGKSGGEYDLVYILNQDTIKARNLTERTIQDCVKLGINAGVDLPSGSGGKGSVKLDHCKPVTTKDEASREGKAVVDQVMTSVKGGTIQAAAAMNAKLNKEGVMDVATFQQWAASIPDVPALLTSEPEPIHMLVPLTMPDANTRISNLKQATTEYVAEYNICKCKPCQNGGTLTLLDGRCVCLCPLLFEGKACQNFKSDKAGHQSQRPPVVHEGNWSCWSSWTGCTSGTRSRTRYCKKDGVEGATCRGDDSSQDYC
ncbi:complement component C9 isoform X2 [Mugil cephalus]|uniref:complement component C9 isoform X2 n=1 Tax=Mugil cephalus TaxID=48193 RepID=UPI001FB7904D|nr:complement component C9 isoform X2 [Mugil cephalus]